MEQLYWLDRIQPSQAALVGEKALALSQLGQLGNPIVPGFVIPTTQLRTFLERVGQLEPLLADLSDSSLHVDVDDREALRLVARRVREGIFSAELPQKWLSKIVATARDLQSPHLIVRPSLSLPASCEQNFAGLLRSRVCACEPEALEYALKWTWAELFRAGSLFCFARASLSIQAINLALLVQPIQDAIASGTVEICNAEAHVRAVWGLGHSLARGEVQPDWDIVLLSPRPDRRLQRSTDSRVANHEEQNGNQRRVRRLGRKILAYRLPESTPTAPNSENLQVECPSEEQQQNYCLDETALGELIDLTQKLIAERPQICYLEWTLVRAPETLDPPRFSFTQCSSFYRTSVSSANRSGGFFPEVENRAEILRGLPASPGRAIAIAQSIADFAPPVYISPGRILVAKAIAPEWLPLLEGAAGIITEQGGITSHAAIIARELEIPAIVGVRGATAEIETGESLSIDGTFGEIRRQVMPQDPIPPPRASVTSTPPSLPGFPIATQLFLNLSQLSSLTAASSLPVDGVGLLRSELAIVAMLESQPLSWWLQDSQKSIFVKRLTEQIFKFARDFAPRPVFYRSTDWRSPEFFPRSGEAATGRNPILGRRGTFSYTLDATLFEAELAALARVQALGYNNLNLILPFVRCVKEFIFCRDRVRQWGLSQHSSFQLWIMAEVPSVCFLLPEYVKAGVQGISIGTNDLTQLLLGVDREQAELAQLFDERHPAILSAIEQLIERAREMGIPCSICGQAPVLYPELIDRLVEWGITAISVEAGAVEQTYWAIARAEQRLLLEAARRR